MQLLPAEQRRELLGDLTERIVHDYYTERGFDLPEFAYVVHSRQTTTAKGEKPLEHLPASVRAAGYPDHPSTTKHSRLDRMAAQRTATHSNPSAQPV